MEERQKLYILRWNPNKSSYKKEFHKDVVAHAKVYQFPKNFNWSIREWKKVAPGDLFIMHQVGTDNDGIVMIGKIKEKCYEENSWRNDGSVIHYADLLLFDAFDADEKNVLPAEKYEKIFPEISWHHGHSGELLEFNLANRLLSQINKDLMECGLWDSGSFGDLVNPWWSAEDILRNKKEKHGF